MLYPSTVKRLPDGRIPLFSKIRSSYDGYGGAVDAY
jgi:hypothetical protein